MYIYWLEGAMMLIHSNNRAEAIHRLQQQRARNFESLIKEDPEKAWQVAMSNLQSAGILDECGELVAIYTDDSGSIAPLAFTRTI